MAKECDHKGYLVPEYLKLQQIQVGTLISPAKSVHTVAQIVSVRCFNCGAPFEYKDRAFVPATPPPVEKKGPVLSLAPKPNDN